MIGRVLFGRGAAATTCVAFVAGLAACAAPRMPLAPDAAGQLHKIALLEVQEPPEYGSANLYLESFFGGGIVNMQHSKEFTQLLRESGFSISSEITGRLEVALTAAGFEVERVQATRKPYQIRVISHAATTADAILNVSVGAGYVSAYGVDDYIPTVSVRAELLDNRRGQESPIYVELFSYGYANPLLSQIHIDALSMYRYSTFGKLMASHVEAGEGLLKGADLIGDRLAREIATAKH